MTDDIDPTVTHGQESRPGDREAQNHGTVKNALSDPRAVPSAPPNPCSIRVWTGSGENSDTTLLHTVPKRPSKKRSSTVASPAPGCSTTSSHTPSKRLLRPSPRSPDNGRRQSSGLIVRGSTYYLRLRVPRRLAREMRQPKELEVILWLAMALVRQRDPNWGFQCPNFLFLPRLGRSA